MVGDFFQHNWNSLSRETLCVKIDGENFQKICAQRKDVDMLKFDESCK